MLTTHLMPLVGQDPSALHSDADRTFQNISLKKIKFKSAYFI